MAILNIALALAASFGVGRATAPAPARASVSDATLSEVVAQLKIVNRNLGGYTAIAGTPSLNRQLDTMSRQLKAICDNIKSLGDRTYAVCSTR